MATILLVEDDASMRLLTMAKLKHQFNMVCAQDGIEALEVLERRVVDLIIADVMMPRMDGYTLVKTLRERGNQIPVLFLTARGEDEDRLLGLGMGADDYMVKPFLSRELLLRVGIILRRYYKEENPKAVLASCQIDFDRAVVIRDQKEIPLTAKEYEILKVLYRNAGRIVTIDQLCEAAWGDNPFGYENSLMAHIRRIREKIEENPSKPVSLITVKGLGYKLISGR